MVNQKGNWATEKKKERLKSYKKLLIENEGVELKKFLAITEVSLGLKRETALLYLQTWKDLGFIATIKGKICILGVQSRLVKQ